MLNASDWLMLCQGCPRPLLGKNLFPLKVGLRWVFVNGLKWVQKWVKSGFLGAKVGQNASKPTFAPTLNPFRRIHENPLVTQFKGGWALFSKKGPEARFGPSKVCALEKLLGGVLGNFGVLEGGALRGGFPWKGIRSSTLASTPSSTQRSSQHPPRHFQGFPVALFKKSA